MHLNICENFREKLVLGKLREMRIWMHCLCSFHPCDKKGKLISLPSAKLVAEFQARVYEVGRPFFD